MPRTTRELFAEEDAPILRFEESDDFRHVPVKAANYSVVTPMSNMAVSEDPFSELKQKQESLLRIRQELETTQREAEELEARKQKEERFATGRRDVCERLSRSLAKLERELYNSQKAIEEISLARDSFQQHLDALRDIHPEAWGRSNLDDELDRAIGAVDDAEDEFAKSSRRLSLVVKGHDDSPAASFSNLGSLGLPTNFSACVMMGLAFTLPLIIATLLVVLVIKYLP